MTKLIAMVILMFCAVGAMAQHGPDGMELQQKCAELDRTFNQDPNANHMDGAFCAGYIAAVLDLSSAWVTESVTVGQTEVLFMRYIGAHPEKLSRKASDSPAEVHFHELKRASF